MTEALVTICMDCGQPLLTACVNTTEYWCLEGVKIYYTYEPCYHQGIECALDNFLDYLGAML